MITIQLLVFSAILGWIYFLWSRRRYYALMLKIPGPMGYPLIGLSHQLRRTADVLPVSEKLFNKYGKTFLFWLGPMPCIGMADPQLSQEVLNSPHCVNKSRYMYGIIAEMLGNGILTSDNPLWSKHRKLLNPAFKQNVMLQFLPVFNDETKGLLELMDTYVGKGAKDIHSDMMHSTLQIITLTTGGTEVKEEPTLKTKSLEQSYEYLAKLVPDIMFWPWLRSTMIRKLKGLHKPLNDAKSNILAFISKMIDIKLRSQESFIKNPVFLFEHVIAHLKSGQFTYQQAIAEANTILGAGFETTGGAVFNTLALLAIHPEYQDRVYEELLELYPNTGNFEVTFEDIQKLDYLDRVFNESMRLIPPGPLIVRQCMEDVPLSNGILIPKGTAIGISIFHMHRSEDFWGPDAKKFNPDNFLPDNIQSKHSYTFMPFVKGIRTCIGWRYALIVSKIMLVKLLRNYKFSTKFRYDDLSFLECVTIKLAKTPLLELERRSK